MRGRPRKPTRVLELSGAFAKDPQRRREREGEPVLPLGVGDPPAYFDAVQREAWGYLAECGAAWLTAGDRPVIEEAAKYRAESRLGQLSSADLKRYHALLRDLGFGPAMRRYQTRGHST